MSWNLALGVGSGVLLAGGLTAIVRRAMRISQALGVLIIAVGVAAITAAGTRLAGDGAAGALYTTVIVLSCAVGGIAMAVTIVARKPSRRP